MKYQLHLHTTFSGDSLIKPERAVKILKKNNFFGFSFTEHNTFKSQKKAKQLAKENKLEFIPGIEISTKQGHLIGLYVEDERLINKKRCIQEVIEIIHENGGLAIAPHAFDIFRKGLAANIKINKLKLDAIETINSKANPIFNYLANKYANKNNIAKIGGADAHCEFEITNAWTEIEKDAYKSIKKCETKARGSYNLNTIACIIKKKITRPGLKALRIQDI